MADELKRNCWVPAKVAAAQSEFSLFSMLRACRRRRVRAEQGLGGEGAWRVYVGPDGYPAPGPNALSPEQRARRRERQPAQRGAHRSTRARPRAPAGSREE
jgi:hypothetical protein